MFPASTTAVPMMASKVAVFSFISVLSLYGQLRTNALLRFCILPPEPQGFEVLFQRANRRPRRMGGLELADAWQHLKRLPPEFQLRKNDHDGNDVARHGHNSQDDGPEDNPPVLGMSLCGDESHYGSNRDRD